MQIVISIFSHIKVMFSYIHYLLFSELIQERAMRDFIKNSKFVIILSAISIGLTAGLVMSHAAESDTGYFFSDPVEINSGGLPLKHVHVGPITMMIALFLALALSGLFYAVSIKYSVDNYIKWGDKSINGPITVGVLVFGACYIAADFYHESKEIRDEYIKFLEEKKRFDEDREYIRRVHKIVGDIPLIAPLKARFKIDCIGQIPATVSDLSISEIPYLTDGSENGIIMNVERPLKWRIHNRINSIFAEYEMGFSSIGGQDRASTLEGTPIYNVVMKFNSELIAQICPPIEETESTSSGRRAILPEVRR